MERYIRFQTAMRCPDTARPLGVFIAAGYVEDSLPPDADNRTYLREVLEWFDQNLKAPSVNECCWRSLFWFRADAGQCIGKIWDLIAVLKEEGVAVQLQHTANPGQIVYWDEFQVAAIPHRPRGG